MAYGRLNRMVSDKEKELVEEGFKYSINSKVSTETFEMFVLM